MKKYYMLAFAAFALVFAANAQVEIEDDFEFYNLGDISEQNSYWRTWSGVNGGAEDADVVDTEASSGELSMLVDNSGVVDQLLLIESVPTSGLYTIQWRMLIPANSEGYFNMQGQLTPAGVAWEQYLQGGNVFFNEAGGAPGVGTVDGTPGQTFNYPEEVWFLVTCVYDLDNETWALSIDGNEQFNDQEFTFNDPFVELAAIDFFSVTTGNTYYVDDVTLAVGTLGVDDFSADVFSVYPNPVIDVLNIRSAVTVDKIAIYDVLGKNVLEATPDVVSPSIDMSALNSGIYLIQVTIGNASKTVKVLK